MRTKKNILMNINITLCDKVLIGDIPEYNFNNTDEAMNLINHWLENKDMKKSVFVCFQTLIGLPKGFLRDEQLLFLVGHQWDLITDFSHEIIRQASYGQPNNIDFSIFEFETYVDAFEYCKDLKELF